jgi:hypothetical protein
MGERRKKKKVGNEWEVEGTEEVGLKEETLQPVKETVPQSEEPREVFFP